MTDKTTSTKGKAATKAESAVVEPTVENESEETRAKRKSRTLEERIAELQAEAERREAKAAERAKTQLEDLTVKYERSKARTLKLATEIVELSNEAGLEVPASIASTTVGEGDVQVELDEETASA